MKEDPLDVLLRDAAHTYNPPPAEPPLEQMWQVIEGTLPGSAASPALYPLRGATSRSALGDARWARWLRTAAVLLLGIGAGRASLLLFPNQPSGDGGVAEASSQAEVVEWRTEEQWLSEQYLGQTAALLIALPAELGAQRPDSSFAARADELLLQTRLLLDSPSAGDPLLRTLLEDLEVVLVQVVRLQTDRDPLRVDLLRQSLEQHELMPRLRHAVISHTGD